MFRDASKANIFFRSIFRDYHLNKDPTCLHTVAKGMMALQAAFGFIPRIYGKGRSAKQLCEYMMNLRKENQAAELELSVPPQFDTLIILDRQVCNYKNSWLGNSWLFSTRKG